MKVYFLMFLILNLFSPFANQSSFALVVNVLGRSNFTENQSAQLGRVSTLLNHALNGEDFKNAVLNFSYQGKKQFVQNNGMTNEQIYHFLMSGAEKYPTAQLANEKADMNLTIYYPRWYSRSSAVAFTSTSDPFLHIYNNYYNTALLSELSNTLVHEWTHKMGFDHDYKNTPQRPFSVPYGVGGIIEGLVSRMNPN